MTSGPPPQEPPADPLVTEREDAPPAEPGAAGPDRDYAPAHAVPPAGPGADPASHPVSHPVWRPTRADLTGALVVLGALVLLGAAIGALWFGVAPRLGYRIDSSHTAVPLDAGESEALVGADAWFAILVAITGLAAGIAVWWWRSVRGPATVLALAVGGVVGALLASWVGQKLGQAPSESELRAMSVGVLVHGPLRLRATVALVVEPFVAVAAYVIATGFAGEDDLGR